MSKAQALTSESVRQFSPLDRLSSEDSQELLRTSITSHLSAGTPIFDQNTQDKRVYFLVEGEVSLYAASREQIIIAAGSAIARQPLGAHLPNQIAASAHTDVTLVSFDADMLELFVSWTNPNAYQVTEMEFGQNHELMDKLLRSRGLLRFNEDQIHNLLSRMREVKVHAGDVVVQQDAHDEFYYIVKEGRCQVSRKPEPESKEIKLAVLNEGDAFGEEALLVDSVRNATITMLDDGALMQLSKKDFSEALADPLLNTVSWQESQELTLLGAVFLDVRMPEEYDNKHLPGAFNIPLSVLRLKMKVLDPHRKYIVCCDDGSRSTVAAFLLGRNGFDAFILDGGMSTVAKTIALNQAANEAAAAESTASQNTEPKATAASKPAVTRSLADHWGDVVDDAPQELFAPPAPEQPVEKTKPLISKISAEPRTASVTQISTRRATKAATQDEAETNRHKHGMMVGVTLAMALTAVASVSFYVVGSNRVIQMLDQAYVTVQGYLNSSIESIAVTPKPVTVAPSAKAPVAASVPPVTSPTTPAITPPTPKAAAPLPVAESAPWLDTSDNILPDMVNPPELASPPAPATEAPASASNTQPATTPELF